jgi:hypothetical protein
MSKKHFFLLLDSETTQTDRVADLGLIVCDRKGRIYAQAAILVREYFLNSDEHPLFHTSGQADPLWGKANLPKRYRAYQDMLENGSRTLASVNAVNIWLAKALQTYNPTLTAYNLSFDAGKCANSGIDLTGFEKRFCLWHAAAMRWGHSKAFRDMVLQTGAFNKMTQYGNWSYQTNAEVMARFVTGNPALEPEPHTAFEDALLYELPILTRLVNEVPRKEYLAAQGYDWRKFQVKDYYVAK